MNKILLGCALWIILLDLTTAVKLRDDGDVDNDDDSEGSQDLYSPLPSGPVAPAATVSMAASLNRFGSQEHAGAPAPAAAVPAADSKKEENPTQAAQASADAKNAHSAAESAKQAATVANKVAAHSVHITEHAKSALEDAHDALHKARVDSAGLSDGQKQSLKKAEAQLREATKKAEYGQVKNAKYIKADVDNKKLQKMEDKMSKIKQDKNMIKKRSNDDELDAMKNEIEELRKQLKEKEGNQAEDDAALKDLEDELKEMKKEKKDTKSHDEMKAEIEHLRAEIKSMEDKKANVEYVIPAEKKEPKVHLLPKKHHHKEVNEEQVERYDVKINPIAKDVMEKEETEEPTPVEEKGIDIDTAMPYGDLEPFGREDTAQELTESSVKESDGMVDQLERAEVAEEKRSVFRALTRLRGAAITSFDGVARSQTGNIDEYNKVHKWRKVHPLHHLADEESDISKWAFPDNAD